MFNDFKQGEDAFDKEMKLKEDKIRDLQQSNLSNGFDEVAKMSRTAHKIDSNPIPVKTDDLIGNKYVDFIEKRNEEI